MPYLYLVRHPQAQINLNVPAHTWSLSASGRAQLDLLLAADLWQDVVAVYASTEYKARFPAEAAANRYGIPAHTLESLGELNRRAYTPPDSESYTAAVAACLANPQASYHGWETAAAALDRFKAGIMDILDQHMAADSVAVIAHGLVLVLYWAHLCHKPPALQQWQTLGFAAAAAIDRETMQPVTGFLPAPYAGLPVNTHAPES